MFSYAEIEKCTKSKIKLDKVVVAWQFSKTSPRGDRGRAPQAGPPGLGFWASQFRALGCIEV